MAERTHRICERCWFDGSEVYAFDVNGAVRLPPPGVMELDQPGVTAYRHPTQVREAEPSACCVCGGMTITGIFFRHDQEGLLCKSRHEPGQLGVWSRVGAA